MSPPNDTEKAAAKGEEITLDSGAVVALFRDVEPGVHGICFTNGDVKTRIKVSDDALHALVILAMKGGGMCWTVA